MNKITLRKFSSIVTELVSKYGANAKISIGSLISGSPVLSVYDEHDKLIIHLENEDLGIEMTKILDIL